MAANVGVQNTKEESRKLGLRKPRSLMCKAT